MSANRNNDTPSFGEALREARQAAGMTLSEASAVLGFSIPYIADIERDRRAPPSESVISKAAQTYGCDEERLLKLAWMARGVFALDATSRVSSLHHRVGARLGMRWKSLGEEQLAKILAIIDDLP